MYSDFLTRNQTNIYLRYLQPSVDYTAINKMATTNDFYVKRTGVNEDGPLEAITVDGSSSPELLKSASQKMEEAFRGKSPKVMCCPNLVQACVRDHPSCLTELLQEGVDPNTLQGGSYALIVAVKRGNGKCLQLLLESSGIDISVKNREGLTAFEHAACHGRLDRMKMIVDSGVGDPNIKSALGLAISASHHDVVEFLLQQRPDIDVDDEIGLAKKMYYSCQSAAKESCYRTLLEYKGTKGTTKYYLVIVNSRHSDPDVYLIDPANVSDALLQKMREQMGDYPSFLYKWKRGVERPPSIDVKFDELQNFTVCRTFFYNA